MGVCRIGVHGHLRSVGPAYRGFTTYTQTQVPSDDIIGAFTDFDLFGSGVALIMSFVDGILSVGDTVKDAVKGVFDKVTGFLPFSDAKVGPFSNLTESGRSIIETLAAGARSAGGLDFANSLFPVGPAPQPALAGAGQGGETRSP